MLNVVAYIRTKLSCELLSQYFCEGLCSRTLLGEILDKGSEIVETSPENISRETFEKFGPGLLSTFDVCDDFLDAHVLSHTGGPGRRYAGGHSMVVLGVRKEGGSRIFLLQNWWQDKQFVEVSEDYMSCTDCTVYFVHTPQTFEGDSLPSYSDKFADHEGVDCQDFGPT